MHHELAERHSVRLHSTSPFGAHPIRIISIRPEMIQSSVCTHLPRPDWCTEVCRGVFVHGMVDSERRFHSLKWWNMMEWNLLSYKISFCFWTWVTQGWIMSCGWIRVISPWVALSSHERAWVKHDYSPIKRDSLPSLPDFDLEQTEGVPKMGLNMLTGILHLFAMIGKLLGAQFQGLCFGNPCLSTQ